MKAKGLIQVYTGDGKGKTTAAVGLACRACSNKLKVCYIFFHKDCKKWSYGEHKALRKLGVKIYGYAKKHPHFYKTTNKEALGKDCQKALKFIKRIYNKDFYEVLILDEILISVRDGFLKEKELFEILDSKPERLELVLTGRGASKKMIKKADLVSWIKKIKHPYDKGIKSRKGIEY